MIFRDSHIVLDPFSKWKIWIQGSGGYGTCVIYDLFFKSIGRQNDYFDPQPDSSIQPKAQGLLHMECDFHRTPYMRIISKDLESTQARAPHNLEASRKVLRKDILKVEF